MSNMDKWESVPLVCFQTGKTGMKRAPWTKYGGNWVVDTDTKEGEILFWQPTGHCFCNERNILCIGGEEYYELDMTHFVHGKDWKKCRDPIKESGEVVL